MKRICTLLAALLLVTVLVGCGGSAASSPAAAEPVDYAAVIQQARTDDFNDAYPVFSDGEDGAFVAVGGGSDSFTADDVQGQGQMIFDLLGLDDTQIQHFAISASMMNVKSYGVAIVLPAEGGTDSVTESLQNFVQQQIQAQERYLPDQYEIAKDARVFNGKNGEVILVMSENAADVANKIEAAL